MVLLTIENLGMRILPHFQLFMIFCPKTFADFTSCCGDHQGLGKEGIWCYDIRWCRQVCVQLRLLSFPSFCRAEWDQIPFCARATLLDYKCRDPNAIRCFLVRGTCFYMLVSSSQALKIGSWFDCSGVGMLVKVDECILNLEWNIYNKNIVFKWKTY